MSPHLPGRPQLAPRSSSPERPVLPWSCLFCVPLGVNHYFWIILRVGFKHVPENFLLLQKDSGEEVEVEEFYVKYKNL